MRQQDLTDLIADRPVAPTGLEPVTVAETNYISLEKPFLMVCNIGYPMYCNPS